MGLFVETLRETGEPSHVPAGCGKAIIAAQPERRIVEETAIAKKVEEFFIVKLYRGSIQITS
jgi:hypothetical protein